MKRQFLSRYSEPSQSQQPPPDACAEVASETVSQLPVVLTGLANVPCTSSGPALGLGDLIASAPARGRRPELLKCRSRANRVTRPRLSLSVFSLSLLLVFERLSFRGTYMTSFFLAAVSKTQNDLRESECALPLSGAARKHLKRPPFSTRLIRGRCAHRWIEDARFRTQELEDVCRFVLDDSARASVHPQYRILELRWCFESG